MARKVFVLGFGSCESKVESVSLGLSEYYKEQVEGLSFRQANSDSEDLDRLTKGAEVFTHSAGMTTLKNMRPKAIHAIAPPLPTPILSLIKRAGSSGRDLLAAENTSPEHRERMREFSRDLAFEIRKHPIANLGRLGLIAAFDAIERAIAAKEAGIDADLAFMDRDRLFQPNDKQIACAAIANLSIASLPGGHEEFVCSPAKLVKKYESIRQPSLVG